MDLSLSETQEMLRDSVSQLLRREMSWERVRESQSTGYGDEPLWKTLSSAGWLTLAFPDALGGGGADLLDIAVATEEIAKSAAVVPFVETMSATYAVVQAGTSPACEQLATEVRDSAAGVTAALGPDEAFVVDGLLTGTKRYVDYGQACACHLVAATENGEPNVYLVSAGSPGVSQQPLKNIGRSPQSTVKYHQVPVMPAGGAATLARLTEVATILTCVQLLGYAQFALDLTVGYVRDRFQFSRPLATFQAVQHRCADMATMVEATRFLDLRDSLETPPGRGHDPGPGSRQGSRVKNSRVCNHGSPSTSRRYRCDRGVSPAVLQPPGQGAIAGLGVAARLVTRDRPLRRP